MMARGGQRTTKKTHTFTMRPRERERSSYHKKVTVDFSPYYSPFYENYRVGEVPPPMPRFNTDKNPLTPAFILAGIEID